MTYKPLPFDPIENSKVYFQRLVGRIVGSGPSPPGYRIFTTLFDVEVWSDKLDALLGPLDGEEGASVRQFRRGLDTALAVWRAEAARATERLEADIRRSLDAASRCDTVVTLLLDQSGSMKEERMLFAAEALTSTVALLERLGISVEVLGFTTSKWRGGRAREAWLAQGRPAHPGRLNDLLHIIYKASEEAADGWEAAVQQMLRPSLPKENIDGEAIEWACRRLGAKAQSRRILIVLSDGAPVDDSTLHENPDDFLWEHLRAVIAQIQATRTIALGAVGIGYPVESLYDTSAAAEDVRALGLVLPAFVARMLLASLDWRPAT